VASEGLAAAGPLLAAGASVLGILSANRRRREPAHLEVGSLPLLGARRHPPGDRREPTVLEVSRLRWA